MYSDFEEDSDDSVKDRDYVPVEYHQNQARFSKLFEESEEEPFHEQVDKGNESDSSTENAISNETDNNAVDNDVTNTSGTGGISGGKTRKRERNPENWESNKRKQRHDQGLEYTSSRKKIVPAKRIKNTKDCLDRCLWKCARKITEEERQSIFSEFYKLTRDEKRLFILSTTEKFVPERRRKGKTAETSQRTATYNYFFLVKSTRIQVCKKYYTGTLAISQKPIYNAHNAKNTSANTPSRSTMGKHQKNYISEETINLVKEHINMFPRVESQYCRKNSKREYLESSLSIRKMYELYKNWIEDKHLSPVKESAYRAIFCKNFNLYFHIPKKDRCDLCEEVKLLKKENRLSEEREVVYNDHLKEKEAMRKERRSDRDGKIPVLCFDLENVLTCPKAEISSFFYKSKFTVYNMTAHLSTTKHVYCAVWPETLSGRAGIDIASAVYKILEKVIEDNPEIESLILWSDSCVPQNRNSVMSFAMADFIKHHPNLKTITMKFSTPGHSCVQEIDAVHSCIERVLSKSEYFSPLSLMRLLLQVNRQTPYKIIQMKLQHFKNFQECSSQLKYNQIPYTKVSQLRFTNSQFEVQYKTSHGNAEFETVSIKHCMKTRKESAVTTLPMPKPTKTVHELPQNKVDSILSMYRWMPTVDKEYYNTVLPKNFKKDAASTSTTSQKRRTN